MTALRGAGPSAATGQEAGPTPPAGRAAASRAAPLLSLNSVRQLCRHREGGGGASLALVQRGARQPRRPHYRRDSGMVLTTRAAAAAAGGEPKTVSV